MQTLIPKYLLVLKLIPESLSRYLPKTPQMLIVTSIQSRSILIVVALTDQLNLFNHDQKDVNYCETNS